MKQESFVAMMHTYSVYCSEIYENPVYFNGLHYTDTFMDDKKTDTQAILLESRTEYVIVIRGTSSLLDWVMDIEFWKKKDKALDLHLHRGYRKGAYALLKLLGSLSKSKIIKITGHSLGGSVGVILGMLLIERGYTVEYVITFGSPKVVNYDIHKSIYRYMPLFRVINGDDPVPLFPPKTWWCFWNPYIHFGKEVYLLKDRSGYAMHGMGETKTDRAVDFERRLLLGSLRVSDITFHEIEEYVLVLKNILDNKLIRY